MRYRGIHDNASLIASTLSGLLTGTLGVESSDPLGMTLSNNSNTYSGGTTLSTWGNVNSGSSGNINADANNALGTGPVQFTNTATSNTSTLNFRSAAPVIGSLASTGAGAKFVVLGNTGVNTNLSVGNLDTNTSFGGVMSQFSGQTGSLTKVGDGILTLAGANTYTGATTISEGVIRLASTGSLASTILGFGVGDAANGRLDVLNAGFGFTGTLNLALTPVTLTTGSWNLFSGAEFGPADLNLANVTSDIGLLSFSESAGVWSGTEGTRAWSFTEGTGVLSVSVVPEPDSILLVGVFGMAALALRRRKSR